MIKCVSQREREDVNLDAYAISNVRRRGAPPEESTEDGDAYDLEDPQSVECFVPSLLYPSLHQHLELVPPACVPFLCFHHFPFLVSISCLKFIDFVICFSKI